MDIFKNISQGKNRQSLQIIMIFFFSQHQRMYIFKWVFSLDSQFEKFYDILLLETFSEYLLGNCVRKVLDLSKQTNKQKSNQLMDESIFTFFLSFTWIINLGVGFVVQWVKLSSGSLHPILEWLGSTQPCLCFRFLLVCSLNGSSWWFK